MSSVPSFEALVKAGSGVYWGQHQLSPLCLPAGLGVQERRFHLPALTLQPQVSPERVEHPIQLWNPMGQLCVCANVVFPF